jgi:hypothetical protein
MYGCNLVHLEIFDAGEVVDVGHVHFRFLYKKNKKSNCNCKSISNSGTDVMILKIFSQKNLVKKLAFLLKILSVYLKNGS